ncbi:MAG: citrate lyase acyl carrier protein [Oscillospiraceae bacterium]|jgi:citrate lyase subunit gamma (acyl carrier protein)|nr:citrate lyase acyl carrier protein [Oscillospiraceae bacterium]
MRLIKKGIAGTLESGDISVEVEARDSGGVEIELSSTVEALFGRQLRQVIEETLKENGVEHAVVRAGDKGALDCTVRARVTTAIYRGAGSEDYRF